MVGSFKLLRLPLILFGNGQFKRLPEHIGPQRQNLLLLTGSTSYRQIREWDEVFSKLQSHGHTLHIGQIGHEPSPDDIDSLTAIYRNAAIDSVIAIGGGSVMDAGKAISAMLVTEGPVTDYLEGVGKYKHPGTKVFFTAIPTTSGTGSETTANAVLSITGANGFKRSLRHENLVPDLALVDPALTLSCPPSITAAGGMDAFTQLVESYLSTKSNDYTDALAVEGITHIHKSLLRAFTNGNDMEARAGMSYAAMLSGITLSNAGLGLVHGFASSLGGFFNIPHGLIGGTLMGTVNRYNVNALLQQSDQGPFHHKYARLGEMFSGIQQKSASWYMQFAADYFDQLTAQLNIGRLGEYGVTEADLERIALHTDHKANPVQFGTADLVDMLKTRL
ncbi:MAG: iron-containing alcohol dehydrogenase [Bacteroidales bacterium]|nr:iron-containing alcohol dehydrogenase [Bacteroidales bacterium]